MRLEITAAQAESLRAQNAKVIEETKYYAVVADVAKDKVDDPIVLQPRPSRRGAYRTKVVGSHMLRRTRKTPNHREDTLSGEVWTAITQLVPNTKTEIRRCELEEQINELLPEYTPLQIMAAVSKLITGSILRPTTGPSS